MFQVVLTYGVLSLTLVVFAPLMLHGPRRAVMFGFNTFTGMLASES